MLFLSPWLGTPVYIEGLRACNQPVLKENAFGEGGYGVVYRGNLINGTPKAVKKLLNNLGQVEKEFRVEVEAIGHVATKT
ncbi:hypothetical protein IFM89_021991 [Coptis chinensis]|uniref:Uncharacterized protein n=1 Tax=Coptis chinensis TaxID=261450 RepID=A0A835I2Y0_9MAGN|nr:hypothetical protein IFM89_021991 [Coptis chinensis]